jgi:hypothetical protein
MTLVITPAGDLQWSVIDSETGTIVASFISRGRAHRFVDGQSGAGCARDPQTTPETEPCGRRLGGMVAPGRDGRWRGSHAALGGAW